MSEAPEQSISMNFCVCVGSYCFVLVNLWALSSHVKRQFIRFVSFQFPLTELKVRFFCVQSLISSFSIEYLGVTRNCSTTAQFFFKIDISR